MEFMLLYTAIKNLKNMNAKSQDYDDYTKDEGIDNYFSYDQFNYTEPKQSNTRNYGYNSVDITKIEAQGRTQRVIDIVSTIVVCIPVVCLIIAFFYTRTQKVITVVSTVFIITFICSMIAYFYLYYI
jgi:hypothetical protein